MNAIQIDGDLLAIGKIERLLTLMQLVAAQDCLKLLQIYWRGDLHPIKVRGLRGWKLRYLDVTKRAVEHASRRSGCMIHIVDPDSALDGEYPLMPIERKTAAGTMLDFKAFSVMPYDAAPYGGCISKGVFGSKAIAVKKRITKRYGMNFAHSETIRKTERLLRLMQLIGNRGCSLLLQMK